MKELLFDIAGHAAFIPRAILLTFIILASYVGLCIVSGKERPKLRELIAQWRAILFIFYLSFVLMITVFSRPDTEPLTCVYDHFWFRDDIKWNNQIIENILVFIPLTIFYLVAFKPKRPFVSSLILSASVTVIIELSQLLFRLGSFQFSDILYNTIGGLIGYLIWLIVKTIVSKVKNAKRGKDDALKESF